jgi:ubiquinone biosynthesis protein Coq4
MTRTEQLHTFYTETVNNLTLEQALIEHYKINPQFTRYYQFASIEGGSVIKRHDISHIIYGCDTSMLGEYKVQMWNNFGSKNTTPKLSFKLIFSSDIKALVQLVLPTGLIKYARVHKEELGKVKTEVKTQSDKMTKKWIYGHEETYMQKTIAEIRAEYGIEIIQYK